MSRLARILQRHNGSDYFNSKILQHAGRFDSRQSAYNLIHGGSEAFEKVCDLIRRLPLPVALDCLGAMCDGLPVAVVSRERCDGSVPPGLRAVVLVEGTAAFCHELFVALTDGKVDDQEFDGLAMRVAGIESELAKVKDAIASKRPNPRSNRAA